MKDPSIRDIFAGMGTAVLAGAIMLMAVLVPTLLVMEIVDQGAGRLFAAILIAAGVIFLAIRLTQQWQRDVAQRRH
jgi:hypothetical protein